MDKPFIKSTQDSILRGQIRYENPIINISKCNTVNKSSSNDSPSIVFSFGPNDYVHWAYLSKEDRDLDLARIIGLFTDKKTTLGKLRDQG